MTLNRVHVHGDADSIILPSGRTFCIPCLDRYSLAVDPDNSWHEDCYHNIIPAGLFAAAMRERERAARAELDRIVASG